MATFATRNTATVFPPTRYFAQAAPTWADQWKYIPWLLPVFCVDRAAPDTSQARFRFEAGEIKQHDTSSFAAVDPLRMSGWPIQICIQYPGQRPQPVWTGIIESDHFVIDREGQNSSSLLTVNPTVSSRAALFSGPQFIDATGLGYLLDRAIVATATVSDGTDTVKIIDTVPRVNERWKRGKTLRGNRSSVESTSGTYVYQHNNWQNEGSVWTNLQYIEYILLRYAPTVGGLTWKLTGDTESLDAIEGVYDFDRHSVWSILNTLISREHGLGFSIHYENEGGTANIEVFTLTEKDISYGEKTLKANPKQVSFAAPSGFPHKHLVDDIPLRVTTTNKFDDIVCQGELMLGVASFDVDAGDLEGNWTNARENGYKDTGSDDVDYNMRWRADPLYHDVYRKYIVPRTWNGMVGADDAQVVLPTSLNDGTFDTEVAGPFWRGSMKFEKHLPLFKNVDYAASPPTDEIGAEDQPEYIPLLGIMYDGFNGAMHEADSKFHQLDRLGADFSPKAGGAGGVKSMQVHSLDNDCGVFVNVHPNHYLALRYWDGAREDWELPEFSYDNLTFTAAIRHSQRMTIQVQINKDFDPETEVPRTLRIYVRGAEYWRAAPRTVFRVNEAGEAKYIHADNLEIRNDVNMLWSHVAFATAWFGKDRQSVQIPLKKLGIWVPLGTYITGINNISTFVPINTVVTGRLMDFESQTTTIETGHGSLDLIRPPIVAEEA